MEKHILTRDGFVNEIYSHRPQEEVNEGILDFFKTIVGKEWNSIKSKAKNKSLVDALEKVDKSLGGFSFMKMSKTGPCKEIRQVLYDFANDLWDAKLKEFNDGKKLQTTLMGLKDKDEVSAEDKKKIENAGKVSDYLRKFDLKDKALIDKLETHEKRIKTICNGDPDLTKWSNLLMDGIRNIINDAIIAEYEKTEEMSDEEKKKLEKTKKRLEKKQKEDEQRRKNADIEQKKKQEDQIKELEKQREKAITNVKATPIKGQTGDKAHITLKSEFDEIYKKVSGGKVNDEKVNESSNHKYSFDSIISENKKWDIQQKAIQGDVHLGLSKLSELGKKSDLGEEKYSKRVIKILNILIGLVDKISKQGKLFKDVPSDSVQALYVGLTILIENALLKGNLNDSTKELLARCSIDSDKTLGYGLPLMNPKNPKEGNIFTAIAQELTSIESKGKIAKVLKNNQDDINSFTKNATKMFNDIYKKAEDLKKTKEKEDEKEVKQAEEDAKK